MRRRPLLRTAALLAAGGLLAGCATIRTTPGWAPRPAVAPEVALTASGDDSLPTDTPGLDVRVLFNADPAAGIGARWAEIPGDAPLNDELRARVRDAISAQTAATGVRYRPSADGGAGSPACSPDAVTRPAAELVADPALTPQGSAATVTVVCAIVVAAGTVLGEALRIVTASGGRVSGDTTTVYYADAAGGFLTTKDALLTDDGLRALLGRVVQSLKVAAGALEPQMKEDPAAFPLDRLRAWFSDFTLRRDGSLALRLPADFTTPELDGLAGVPDPSALEVTVPPTETTPLLSPEGARVQAALASGAPLALPAAAPRGTEDVDCRLFACLALTFDDGPGPYTGGVLDALAARRAAATFFLQGIYVSRYRATVIRMRDEGHQIANHTWNHPDLTKLPPPEVTDQVARTSALIRSITGAAPTMFRPPYGAYTPEVLAEAGLPAILWSLDTNDWREPGDAALLDRVVGRSTPGDIVLMHDVHQTTARMVPQLVDGLLDRGFTLVTVKQLLGGAPAAGTATRR